MKDKNIIKRGKVVELVPKQPSNGFMVRYGIPLGRRTLVNIQVRANNGANDFTYFNDGISSIKNNGDGTVTICINNGELKKTDVEDTLIVIISYAAQLATSCEKIDKMFQHEAVVFMHEGDSVELSQSPKGKKYVYTVMRNKNQLFLVQKD